MTSVCRFRDISELAREYRSQIQSQQQELNEYRRREPLVQLLWHEIVQVKTALSIAVQNGFSYDLSDPTSRYVPLQPNAITQIDTLHARALHSAES